MAELVLNNGSAPSPPSAGKTSIYADSNSEVHILSSSKDLNVNSHIVSPNVIINGDFDIWQRGTSFVAISSGSYTTDRFLYATSGTAVHTITKDTDVPTLAQSGHNSKASFKVDCTTVDSSIGASDYCIAYYKVEGYDYAPLYGNTITLSFWVKCTKTGTYCVAFRNNAADRTYVSEYTINTTNTWEKKTITVTLNQTGGTENYTNGVGLVLVWSLSSGSNYQTTANAWQSGSYFATSNQVNATDSTDNNFWLSQVKLELGSVATPFVSRPYGEELRLCQRYCQAIMSDANFNQTNIGMGFGYSTTLASILVELTPTMRAVPTLTAIAGDWQLGSLDAGGIDVTVIGMYGGANPTLNTPKSVILAAQVASGLTVGRPYFLYADGAAGRLLILSAEL